MKNLFVIIVTFLFFSCKPNVDDQISHNTIACDIENPQKNLPWLSELIEKGETDKTQNYKGSIWLEKYKEEDVFVTNMGLGSGGLAYHFFDCAGNPLLIEEDDSFNDFITHMELRTLLYSNIHY